MGLSLVVTLMGPHNPGLVNVIAEFSSASDTNLLRVRLMNLAGRFAGVQLEVTGTNLNMLDTELVSLKWNGLRVMNEKGFPRSCDAEAELHWLELICQDHPGILLDIVRVLAHNSVSIEGLTADRTAAPFSGGQVFRASAQLRVSGKLVGVLRDRLEALASEMMVDLVLDGPRSDNPRTHRVRGNC